MSSHPHQQQESSKSYLHHQWAPTRKNGGSQVPGSYDQLQPQLEHQYRTRVQEGELHQSLPAEEHLQVPNQDQGLVLHHASLTIMEYGNIISGPTQSKTSANWRWSSADLRGSSWAAESAPWWPNSIGRPYMTGEHDQRRSWWSGLSTALWTSRL